MPTGAWGRRPRFAAFTVVLALLLSACTDEKIVYREPFNPPPDASSGFVGYFTSSDKSTTCGNCHVDHQNKWVTTAHADAYAGLVNSSGAQDFCYSCHTVSENGNQVSTAAGWNVVQDTAYHDVQCESCHGPGVEHIESAGRLRPPAGARPGAGRRPRDGRCQHRYHDGVGLLRRVPQRVAPSLCRRVADVRSRASPGRRRGELHLGPWLELRPLPRGPRRAQGLGRDLQLFRARYCRRRRPPGCHLRGLPRPAQRPVRRSAPLFHLGRHVRGQPLHEVPHSALRASAARGVRTHRRAPCSRALPGSGRRVTTHRAGRHPWQSGGKPATLRWVPREQLRGGGPAEPR